MNAVLLNRLDNYLDSVGLRSTGFAYFGVRGVGKFFTLVDIETSLTTFKQETDSFVNRLTLVVIINLVNIVLMFVFF